MYITQQDVNHLLHFAALSAAQKLGIAQIDWDPTDKLTAAVRTASAPLGKSLDTFIKAYTVWFEFASKLESDGKSGHMNSKETELHAQLVFARDDTRNAFISALKDSV
jgi:hypothetical protein